jgi:dTDP-4-dehydrorhamnose reductase
MSFRVLVFGRSGQVATELQRRAGGDVVVTALGREAADLTDPAACAAMVTESEADAVINAAAYTAVDKAETEEDLAFSINAGAPGAIAAACAARDIPFVHLSTDYVFAGTPGRPWREDDPTGPLGAYGRTKLAGEQAVAAAGARHAILRTAWVFAAHGQNFVQTMLRVGATRDRLTVVDDQIGGPTPADAIADATLAVARNLAAGRGETGLFHFTGQPAISWCGFARAIFERAAAQGLPPFTQRLPEVVGISSEAWPTPAQRPRNSVLDCRRIERVHGIGQPQWQDGLERALRAMGSHEGRE